MKNLIGMSLLLVFGLVFSACSPDANLNDPNRPVDSNDPIPVEPGNGTGGSGDEGKLTGNVYLNDVQLMVMESYPVQVAISISGNLPTPCNELRYTVAEQDADHQIFVEVYSVSSPDEICIEVLEPFTENISLPVQDLPDGSYTVFVNGELVGEFSYPG